MKTYVPYTSLIKAELEGFESESSSDSEVERPITLPPIPTNREKKLAKKAAKSAKAAVSVPSKPGTVYLGHIPHGFFERQMQEYFSQFGTVTRLRLSRNRRTGKSKHYGWVEFASHDVAEIVAETMDGYLIHPHRLVCKVVEVDERVWNGANRVYKKIPWVRINREKVEAKRSKDGWESLVKRDEERSRKRAEKIKALGIDYEAPVRGEKRKAEDIALPPITEKKAKKDKSGKEKSGKKVAKDKAKSKAST
jgi:nucleolar protein 15